MAIRTVQVSLDIQPCCDARGPVVCGRQGDEGTVLNVTVTQNGQAMPLDGLTAKLLGNNPNLLQLVGTVSGSTATFTLPSAFFSAVGIVRLYVQLAQGSDVVASTQTFTLKVAPGADLSASQAQGYVTQLDEALATAKQASQTAETAAEQATQAVDDANEALQTANTAVQNANTAATAANAAAENANSAAAAARGNVLKGTVTDASIAHVEDAYAGAVAKEIRVMGKTRQNLWSNPPTNTQNGIALTSNADGSLTLDGTASEASYFYVDVYCLKPGTSYTLSLDRSVNASISVQSYGDSGYIADSVFVGKGSTSAVGTVSQNATKFRLMVQMNAGTTNDNVTVRVMLNEGSEAQPWCPPGLNSVDELSIVTAGKNLAIVENIGTGPENYNKLVSPKLAEGVYTVSGILRKNTVVNIKDGSNSGDTISSHVESLPKTLSIRAGQSIFVNAFNTGQVDKSVNIISNIQIELGSTATAYEPPTVTTTPVDLDGLELRSLPDGTCDVLTWDETEAVEVEQNIIEFVFDGSNDEEWLFVSNYIYGSFSGRKNVLQTEDNTFATLPIVATSSELTTSSYACLYISATYINIKNAEGFASLSEAREWLSENPVTMYLIRDATQTVPLAPATMPALPESTSNVWAACDPPTEVDLTYERDLTIAYDNLASQIATTAAALAVAQATD